jgi:glycosyltransferase involved in cell wall biosynthesis
LQIARKIAQSEILFIYGENPYHSILAILSRLLNPKIKIYFKLADPKSHKGVNILNAFIHFLSKIILIIFSNHVIIASLNIFENASKIIVNLSKNKVNIAHFGNLIGLKKISEEIKLKEYAKRHYDLIFFGRLEKYKGIDRFLNILEIFKINNIKINALIIGSGRKIINNNLNITYINNYLSDKDFCEILNDSKIGVFLYSESTGSHVVQNTNLFGGWAVVSNVGYLKDCILKDGNGDIIERAASDYEIYEIILKRLDFINNSIISPNEVKELSISLFDNNDFSKIILNG